MNDAQREIALFRYSLIREAADDSLTTRQRGVLVRELAARPTPARAANRSVSHEAPSTGGSGGIDQAASRHWPLSRVTANR